MRTESEMYDLILETARTDPRIRAVILNGSRANPNARRDIFQDYDIVYVVTDVDSFRADPTWVDRFGERIIMQTPDAMGDPPPANRDTFTYLMLFADGNRIDLTLFPVAKAHELGQDSLSRLLLDKDGIVPPLDLPSERSYLPRRPTERQFADCCNEFWWVSTYVAKGLWREEITYAKAMMDQVVRPQLMLLLTWHIGVATNFQRNPGKDGKYFQAYLEPELWEMLLQTYADADDNNTWDALFVMGDLFRRVAVPLAERFGFAYPHEDDRRVSSYLRQVRRLPRKKDRK